MCEGFISQANATSVGLGFPGIPLAMVPGHTGIQGPEEVRRNILEVTLDRVVACLTGDGELGEIAAEPDAQDIVCSGTSREINPVPVALGKSVTALTISSRNVSPSWWALSR